jgi:hypothetical protein
LGTLDIDGTTLLKLLEHRIHIRTRQPSRFRQLVAVERAALEQRYIGPRLIFAEAKLLEQRYNVGHTGGFYHDGRFATLREVVDHYNTFFNLNLSRQMLNDLIEYLKSI